MNRDGSVKWTATSAYGSACVGANGTVYSTGGQVTAIGPDGTNLWVFLGDLPLDGSPVISANGTIYVPATGSHTLYAISSTGQQLWTLTEPTGKGVPATAVAIDAGGIIYYCASNSVLALNEQAAVKWSVFGGFDPDYFTLSVTSPTISPDGVLYAALGSRIYAIHTGTNGPANSPWPMYQQNARHSGKIEKPSLKPPQKRADANFDLQLYGQLGGTFTIESSTNLNTWTSLTSFVATTVPMDVVDTQASNSPSKFYRASGTP
jgi:hypothetical protein